MRHAKPSPKIDADETPGGDSFLDIVANIVGILVLLVVVVGVRAGRQVFTPDAVPVEVGEPIEALRERLQDTVRQARADAQEAIDLRKKIDATQIALATREGERDAATLYLAKLRSELDDARAALEEGDRRDLEASNAIAQAQLKLDRLAREQIALSSVEPEKETETVTITPTPIATGRVDKSLSFRLKRGRLVYVPHEELMHELSLAAQAGRINSASALTNEDRRSVTRLTLGPVEGFRAKVLLVTELRASGGYMRTATRINYMEFEEVTELLGEEPEQAFAPGGYLASRLDLADPRECVIDLYVYSDSFEDAPAVCDRFREKGYRIAQTLKGEGMPIGFAPNGHSAVTQ